MSDVFISYSREDRSQAERLAHALESHGWSVWWDRVIPAGRTFDEVIEEQLEAARCVIVLWSNASVQSRWVRTEAQAALDRGVLVPILAETVEKLPIAFRQVHAADLIGWDGSPGSPAFRQVVGDLGRVLGPPPEARKEPPRPPPEARREPAEPRAPVIDAKVVEARQVSRTLARPDVVRFIPAELLGLMLFLIPVLGRLSLSSIWNISTVTFKFTAILCPIGAVTILAVATGWKRKFPAVLVLTLLSLAGLIPSVLLFRQFGEGNLAALAAGMAETFSSIPFIVCAGLASMIAWWQQRSPGVPRLLWQTTLLGFLVALVSVLVIRSFVAAASGGSEEGPGGLAGWILNLLT